MSNSTASLKKSGSSGSMKSPASSSSAKPQTQDQAIDKSKFTKIIDNRSGIKAGEYLQRCLRPKSIFKFVSAYFTIYGYKEMKEELNSAAEVKFLYGDESNIQKTDPAVKEFDNYILTEDSKLLPAIEAGKQFKEDVEEREQLRMRTEAIECIEWLKKPSVEVKGTKESNLLHGKLYITHNDGGKGESPQRNTMVGSSNFTKRGLGFGKGSNYEINLAVEGDECQQYEDWFDKLWNNDKLVKDIKEEIIDELEKLKQDQSPDFIYHKTLYEIFKERLEADKERENLIQQIGFKETQIYNILYDFQKIATTGILHRLKNYNGCILADSVGLGKTYTALAVIKHYELRGKKVLVFCPKKLRNNWALYKTSSESKNNPLADDNFQYTLLNHTDLSRADEYDKLSGTVGEIELSNLDTGKYDLIVIDESHNFRNDSRGSVPLKGDPTKRRKTRYERLMEDFIKTDKNPQVLMLSATPVNNSLIDLRNQIYLMGGKKEDHFADDLGISHIKEFFTRIQKKYSEWAKENPDSRERLEKALGDDFLLLLDQISISRAREHIEEYYSTDDMQKFPAREKPQNRYSSTDKKGEIKYEELYKKIEEFKLSVYRPAAYVGEETATYKKLEEEGKNLSQMNREVNLIHMLRINMLKRLESSAHAFVKTMENIIAKIDKKIDLIDEFTRNEIGDQQAYKGDKDIGEGFTDEGDEEIEKWLAGEGQIKLIPLKDMDLEKWRKEMTADRKILESIRKQVAVVDKDRDAKLEQLREDILNKLKNPTKDRKGKICRKLLIFTSFADTASYLYESLRDEIVDMKANVGLVTGTRCKSSIGISDFDKIITHFSPESKSGSTQEQIPPEKQIDILIATDCISEGQNLQDCDTVISYDIHWNPVRIIQRFGRVDRIGSYHKKVRMINFWPTEDLDSYIKIERRIRDKMALVDFTATSRDNPIEAEDNKVVGDMFRDQLNSDLRELHRGSEDFYKINEDEFNVQNYTLEDFRARLMQYIAQNEDKLKNAPNGLFAVTDTRSQSGTAKSKQQDVPGFIFLLKQKNLNKDANKLGSGLKSNHIYPYFLAYMKKDATQFYGYRNVKDILISFSDMAFGKQEPDKELCERFDKDTVKGKDLGEVENTLKVAINETYEEIKKINLKGLSAGHGRNIEINQSKDLPQNYELITWLVVY